MGFNNNNKIKIRNTSKDRSRKSRTCKQNSAKNNALLSQARGLGKKDWVLRGQDLGVVLVDHQIEVRKLKSSKHLRANGSALQDRLVGVDDHLVKGTI